MDGWVSRWFLDSARKRFEHPRSCLAESKKHRVHILLKLIFEHAEVYMLSQLHAFPYPKQHKDARTLTHQHN